LLHATIMRRLVIALAMAACAIVTAPAFAQQSATDTNAFVQGEKTLEGRLMAPCCWTQTLDIHESPVSTQLRLEIRKRLLAGEDAAAIENDMVARYGERIRAVPKGSSLTGMGVWLSIAVALSGIGVGFIVVRWARRGRRDETPKERFESKPGSAKARDEWDERLDGEMNELSD
jgi:cytochrome c-type biogenesis protein CcmH